MSHKRVLFWVLLLMAGTGLVDSHVADGGVPEPVAELHLLVGLAVSYLCFLWYRSDSEARGYPRSRWMSVSVVAFAAGAIPYYLLRSRGEGERGHALMLYAAYLALMALAVWVGMATQIALM
jgi:hypothetical protein